ncbi:outer membrane protein assembly factor BamB family protein [Streptomyces sp. BRA346]|uniref:outer membrane protein assembly factor BamB family protein n=1 Tax=Streptomyces sp. BRA346 TaxID=2878199 RepID=UPI004062E30A
MEPPHVDGWGGATDDDGTPRIGPYRVLAPWDGRGAPEDARRCLARDDRSGRTVVLTLPHPALADDPAYRVRFRAEAENSRRLTGRWAPPVADIAPADARLPWVAHDCFPALTLPAALAAHGGPLPEPVVRALGAALAETLAGAHANGLVFAGISPGAVLLTADGPRLTGYGLVRAAALDRVGRAGLRGVDPAALPPEQRAGERPRPHGDVYALGAVLACAATGRTPGVPDALPDGLRTVVTACLSADPAHRPRPAGLIQALRTTPAGTGGGLPRPIAHALAEQADRYPVEAVPDAAEPVGRDHENGPSRRSLTIGGLAGVAGLVVGTGAVATFRAAADDGPGRPAPLSVRGTAPAPLWRRDIDIDVEEQSPPVILGGRYMLFANASAATITAVRLRDGKKLWTRENMWSAQALRPLGGGLFLKASQSSFEPEFAAISMRTGRVVWTERAYDGTKRPAFQGPLATRGNTIWFMATEAGGGDADREKPMVIAYDARKREELWRTPLPDAGSGGEDQRPGVLRDGALIIENNGASSDGLPWTKTWSYVALRQRDGRKLWTRAYKGVVPSTSQAYRDIVSGGLLIACDGRTAHAHDLTSGTQRWRFTAKGYLYTEPAVRGRMLCVTDEHSVTYAVDTRTGHPRWRREAAFEPGVGMPYSYNVISDAGRTVLQANASEIEALNAADGSRRWRFAPVGSGQGAGGFDGFAGSVPGMVLVMNGRSLYALPVD